MKRQMLFLLHRCRPHPFVLPSDNSFFVLLYSELLLAFVLLGERERICGLSFNPELPLPMSAFAAPHDLGFSRIIC
jgi:hypothetical protein